MTSHRHLLPIVLSVPPRPPAAIKITSHRHLLPVDLSSSHYGCHLPMKEAIMGGDLLFNNTFPDEELEDNSNVQVLVSDENESASLPTSAEADYLVAQQLLRLSIQDRERVYHDLHGVSDAVQETPGLITRSLELLEMELQNLPEKVAYEAAKAMNPDYVHNQDYRLRFLRADLFDAKAAALRMARHFETKMELFGRDKLGRDIVQDDLDDITMSLLYSGIGHQLPQRDRAGRVVCVYTPGGVELNDHNKQVVCCKLETGFFSFKICILTFSLLGSSLMGS